MDYICPNKWIQMKLFGQYIRELRENQNLPLRKVAAFLDIDTSILSKIERSERSISYDQITKIAEFFKIDSIQLYEEYLSEQVAKSVYLESNVSEILQVAEQKAKYLKAKCSKQSEIEFNG